MAFPLLARRPNERVVAGVRVLLVLGCGVLLLYASNDVGRDLVSIILLAVVATAASIPLPWPSARGLQAPLEAVLACGVVLTVEPLPEALLPYLLAPALAAGLFGGIRTSVTAAGLAGLTLLFGYRVGEELLSRNDYLAVVSQWTLLTLALGLLGAWVQRLQSQLGPQDAYASAYRLISQLRLVARQLSGGLDPVALGQNLLQQLRAEAYAS